MSDSAKSSPAHSFKGELYDEVPASPDQTVIAGWLKFRDQKKWKLRWGVVTKLSPAADCLHLQLYRDNRDRYRQGMTKASLSLEHFLGTESGFTLDKESNTVAIICRDVIVIIAFDSRKRLIEWQMKIHHNLGESSQFPVHISSSPAKVKLNSGPAKMHIQNHNFCLTYGLPPKLIGYWEIKHLRRYGVVDGKFGFEGGSLCGKGEGLYVLLTDECEELSWNMHMASQGKLIPKRRYITRNMSESPSRRYTQRASDSHTSSIGSLGSSLHDGSCQPFAAYEWPSADLTHDTVSEGKQSEYFCHPQAQSFQDHQWTEFNLDKFTKTLNFHNEDTRSEINFDKYDDSSKEFLSMDSYMEMKHPKKNPEMEDKPDVVEKVLERPPKPLKFKSFIDCEHPVIKSAAANKPSIVTDEGSCIAERISNETNRRNSSDLYDVPKTFSSKVQPKANEQHCGCTASRESVNDQAANGSNAGVNDYDVPPMAVPVNTVCSCTSKMKVIVESEEYHSHKYGNACPCQHFITCWPYNWLQLAYCRRGNTIQDSTQMPFKMIRCAKPKSNFDSTPLYAQVDLSKKTKYRQHVNPGDVATLKPSRPTESKPKLLDKCGDSGDSNSSYTNLYFGNTLKYYENAKELMKLIQQQDNEEEVVAKCPTDSSDCVKCSCQSPSTTSNEPQQENYIIMNPVCSVVPTNKYTPVCETANPSRKLAVDNACTEFPPKSLDKLASLSRKRSDSLGSSRSVPMSTSPFIKPDDDMKFMKSDAVRCKSKSSVNRDSSSSNDSGFSFASSRSHGGGEGMDGDQPAIMVRNNSFGADRAVKGGWSNRAKVADPLIDIALNFHAGSLSASNTDMPVCHQKTVKKETGSSKSDGMSSFPFIDAQSTSSETSDISDYIETLSMSSHSSSDTTSHAKLPSVHHSPSSVLRPRSGKEYEKVNRVLLQE